MNKLTPDLLELLCTTHKGVHKNYSKMQQNKYEKNMTKVTKAVVFTIIYVFAAAAWGRDGWECVCDRNKNIDFYEENCRDIRDANNMETTNRVE